MSEQLYFDIKIGDISKWSDMYDSEEELVQELIQIDTNRFGQRRMKGGQYVESFQKQLQSGKDLSSKQLTQLKRIAKWVKIYHLEKELKIL